MTCWAYLWVIALLGPLVALVRAADIDKVTDPDNIDANHMRHIDFCYGGQDEPESLHEQGQALMRRVLLAKSMKPVDLPILLVCGHPAVCSDVIWQLTSNSTLHLPREQIHVYGHYLAGGMRDARFVDKNPKQSVSLGPLAEVPTAWRLSRKILAADAGFSQTYADLSRRYPVVICTFPTNQCGGFFQYQPRLLVLHFSHRWHHHLDAAQALEFHSWMLEAFPDAGTAAFSIGKFIASPLLTDGAAGKLVLVANNPLDVHHIYQYLGVLPLCLPSLYGGMLDYSYSPLDAPALNKEREILLLPHSPATVTASGAVPSKSSASSSSPSTSIVEMVRSRLPDGYVLKYSREYLNRQFHYPELGRWKVAIALPHATHVAAINEALAMGIPLILPSHSLLAAMHVRYNLITQAHLPVPLKVKSGHSAPNAANTAERSPRLHDLHCDINTNASAGCLQQWLRLADFFRFPGNTVVKFSHMDALPGQINRLYLNDTRRREVSERQRAWIRGMLGVSSEIIWAGLTGL